MCQQVAMPICELESPVSRVCAPRCSGGECKGISAKETLDKTRKFLVHFAGFMISLLYISDSPK